MIYSFDTRKAPEIYQIGGKAKALIELSNAGFPVPKGLVLSVDFFGDWLKMIKSSDEWMALLENTRRENCEAIKVKASNMVFSKEQAEAFNKSMKHLDGQIFAVRSSSPEEDLKGTSFAGMYETSLGVNKSDIEKAVAHAFSSCLDYRVMSYKKQNNISLENTSIAVVVQRQIDSDVSGVGFSINPLSNDYDETLINASFGLGESIVSGLVTPDQFTIDKVKNEIISKVMGKHEIAINLKSKSSGGVIKSENKEQGKFSLYDEKILELSKYICHIEEFYGFPIDIEWAYENDQLYILQARPITAYFQLDEHLKTKAGEKRMLYMDINLIDALTSNVPILPLTHDWYYDAFLMFAGPVFDGAKVDGHLSPKESLFFSGNGRIYLNTSQLLHLSRLEKMMVGGEQADKQIVEISKNIDDKLYKMDKPLSYLKLWFLIRKSPRWMWNARKLIAKSIRAYFKPFKFYEEDFKPKIDDVIKNLQSDKYDDLLLGEITDIIDKDIDNALFTYGFAAIVPLMIAMDKIPKLVCDGSDEMEELSDSIFLGTEDNETIELGISMYKMAKMLNKSDFDDLDALEDKILKRELSDGFMAMWDKFISDYEYRAPNELELSNYRYGDRPKLALQQMSYMVDSEYDPVQSQKQNIIKRQKAYDEICKRLKGKKLRQFKKNYDVAITYSVARDIPKYIWLLENGIVRKRALLEGKSFVKDGLLDAKEDIFYLYYSEIEKARNGLKIDIKKIVADRKIEYKKLDEIISYPLFVDSRGMIPVAKAEEVEDGQLKGHGISRGVRTGRIKVMKNPTEKPIEKGDVLVTYTTDPGWTPLFVNVEAVILQVGGPLQHGGVVAREYGKPCVAGIPDVYRTFKDGQLVKVDGNKGVVTIIEE